MRMGDMRMLIGLRGFLADLLASLLAGLLSPNTMMGIAIVAVWAAISAIVWHRRQRSQGNPGMASGWFIILCFGIALLGIAGAAFGLGLRYSGRTPTQNTDGSIDLYTGKKIERPANPYPDSILTSRYYSTKNKEDIAAILDKTSDALNKKGNDLFLMAETAINKSPWDRPGEDLAPMIDRMAYIEAVTTDFRRDLFEVLYKDYPDYRIELNNLLFPAVPAANFGNGAKGFHNALVVWNEHRDSLDGAKRQEFIDLVNTARTAFAGFREEFLKWTSERQIKIAQTRAALRQ